MITKKQLESLKDLIPERTILLRGFILSEDLDKEEYPIFFDFVDPRLLKEEEKKTSSYTFLIKLDSSKANEKELFSVSRDKPKELDESTKDTLPTKYMIRVTKEVKNGNFEYNKMRKTVIEMSNKYKELNN
jgi:hypothetical protein